MRRSRSLRAGLDVDVVGRAWLFLAHTRQDLGSLPENAENFKAITKNALVARFGQETENVKIIKNERIH